MKIQENQKKVPEEILRDFFKVLGPRLPKMFDGVEVKWDDNWDTYRFVFHIKDSVKKTNPRFNIMTEWSFEKFIYNISDKELVNEVIEGDWFSKIESFYKDVRRYFNVPVSGGLYK